MRYFLFVTLLICLVFRTNSQTITTQYGPLEGSLNGNVHQFLGIPYAQPPIITEADTLRWKSPQPHQGWTELRLAQQFAPVCPQKRFEQSDPDNFFIEGDEDCLHLNIWSPDLTTPDLPVMVFIHGGGNQQGSASQQTGGTTLYHGKNMAERGNVVVVTIQYRLGPLGFLVHPGLEAQNPENLSGNYSVLDQIMALQWIQNNIAAFGGDPANVTIFGESAGGLNVGNLLISPKGKGLFHKAIIQSAVPVINFYNDSRNKGIEYVSKFIQEGTPEQKIRHMYSLDSDSLLFFEVSPLTGGAITFNWQPVLDNDVFTLFPQQAFESGIFNQVPLIIGSNSDEMSLSAPSVVTPAMVNAMVALRVPQEFRSQVLELYPPGTSNDQARQAYIDLLSDVQFTAPARRTAQCVSLNQEEPVWRYLFSHRHTVGALEPLGSYHGMELFYVFNNWENATLGSGILFKPQDESVQVNMLNYWTNFARTGNPNASDLTEWPLYDNETDCYLEIKASPDGNQCGLRTEKSNLWDAVAEFTGCSSSLGAGNGFRAEDFRVYPNPAREIIFLDLKAGEEFEFYVFNLMGQILLSGKNSNTIDVSDFKAGLYFLTIRLNDKSAVKKILISGF